MHRRAKLGGLLNSILSNRRIFQYKPRLQFEMFIVGKDDKIENFNRQIFEFPEYGGNTNDVNGN